jgi:hypothetical protein
MTTDWPAYFAKCREETTWKARYHYLPALINRNGYKTGAEIGVALAGHCDAILRNCPTVTRLYGIDPYQHREGYDDLMNRPQEEFNAMYQDTLDFMLPHGHRFASWKMPSIDAALVADEFIPHRLDFVHIDGAHSYEDVVIDTSMWWEHIRQDGGCLTGDDYNLPDVARAVQWFAKRQNRELHVEDGVFWWIGK